MTPVPRRRFLAAAGLAMLAGCSGAEGLAGQGTPTEREDVENGAATVRPGETATASPETATLTGGAAGDSPFPFPTAGTRLTLPMDPPRIRENARSGGPPKDGIPSIDDPKSVTADEADDFLDPGDPVFGVVRNGAVKAYPQRILVQHEIANDVLGGEPVSITYCPLTGTVQGFKRGETTFGVSGRLINANLVMYDRATEAWWPQMLATSIPGPWNGDPPIRSLQEFRLVWTTWERWRRLHPGTQVLSTDTGFARSYTSDPYGSYNPRGGYYEGDRLLFPPLGAGPPDDRYDRKRVVLGARTGNGAAAFLKDALRSKHVLEGEIGDLPVVAVYDPRYDTGYVYRNPDGATVSYDAGTATVEDTEYAPDALPLGRIHTFDSMWFAWEGYYPQTNVYD